MTAHCARSSGVTTVTSGSCQTHSRPLVMCYLAEMRELLTRGVNAATDHDDWMTRVTQWLREHPEFSSLSKQGVA